MQCPECGYDNIAGVAECQECGQSLVEFDPSGSELERSISRHSINVLCRKNPATVLPSVSVRDAIASMIDHKIGCLPVVEDERLVGVFTERDVLNRISSDLSRLDEPVGHYMTSDPEMVHGDESIAYALQLMDLGGYRHLIVVDDAGRPTGVFSVRDVLRFLCVRFSKLGTQTG